MTHTNWRYRGRRTPQQAREFREAQRRRIARRWEREREEKAGEPVRRTRVVWVTVQDSERPMTSMRMEAEPTEGGWGRWSVMENGRRIGKRRLGRTAVGKMVAGWLE